MLGTLLFRSIPWEPFCHRKITWKRLLCGTTTWVSYGMQPEDSAVNIWKYYLGYSSCGDTVFLPHILSMFPGDFCPIEINRMDITVCGGRGASSSLELQRPNHQERSGQNMSLWEHHFWNLAVCWSHMGPSPTMCSEDSLFTIPADGTSLFGNTTCEFPPVTDTQVTTWSSH